ncbi:hypothetical protein MKW94_015211, partial [Papaver nudicaule]|nr:hypothetical protein [Papaver nudicaule]
MGISSSKPQQHRYESQNPSPSLLLSSSSSPSSSSYLNPNSLPSTSSSSSYSFPPPQPPPPPPPPPPNCYNSFPPNPPPLPQYNTQQPSYQNPPQLNHHYPPMYPPPPPQNPYFYQQNHYSYDQSNTSTNHWWPGAGVRPHMMMPQQQQLQQQVVLPLVPYQEAKKVRNEVNVHKDTIKIQIDENHPDYHLVSFTFDALVDGSITIFYFAKEGANCRYSPLYPDACMPVTFPFQKGVAQKFHQPSGTGIDLGFFELEDLSKPSPGGEVPLVIYAEACQPPPLPMIEDSDQPLPSTSRAQISEAFLEKNNQGAFQVKVLKQILWFDGERYELRDIYGIGNSTEANFEDDNDPGKECVICLSEPKDTAVLPCRHMV